MYLFMFAKIARVDTILIASGASVLEFLMVAKISMGARLCDKKSVNTSSSVL